MREHRRAADPAQRELLVEHVELLRLVCAGAFFGTGAGAGLRLRGESLIGSTTILRERPRWVAVIKT